MQESCNVVKCSRLDHAGQISIVKHRGLRSKRPHGCSERNNSREPRTEVVILDWFSVLRLGARSSNEPAARCVAPHILNDLHAPMSYDRQIRGAASVGCSQIAQMSVECDENVYMTAAKQRHRHSIPILHPSQTSRTQSSVHFTKVSLSQLCLLLSLSSAAAFCL